MTLLAIAQDVCDLVGIDRPTSVGTNSDVLYAQLRGVIQQASNDVVQRHDWRSLLRFQNVTGDDTPLAADHARFADPSILRRLNIDALLAGTISTANMFVDPEGSQRQRYDYGHLIEGSYVYPNGVSQGTAGIRVYITDNFVLQQAGAMAAKWTRDTDTAIVSENLIMLGAIWRWRSSKGFAYAEDISNYERELERLASADAALEETIVGDDRLMFPGPYTSSPTPSGPINAAALRILASNGYGN